MKILITGANGLLGRYCLNALKEEYTVFGLVRDAPELPLADVHYLNVDLSSNWDTSLLPNDVDIVLHLAQSPHFRDFPQKSLDVFSVNVASTASLLEYAHRIGVSKFIYASSGGVYGSGTTPFKENSPMAPYGEIGNYLGSKLCSEILSSNYSHLMDVSVLRFFFMYGPSQRETMLIPRLINNIKNGRPISLQGRDGIIINPIHVADAFKALNATFSLNGSHTFNIAGSERLSLKEIALQIGEALGVEPYFEIVEGNATELVGNIDAMKSLLYTPTYTFFEGVKDMVNA